MWLLVLAQAWRLLAPSPIPKSIWIPGTILNVGCVVYAASYGVLFGQPSWLEIPPVVAWLVFVAYCGVIIAKETGNGFYGRAFAGSFLLGVIFRTISYRIIGPLYSQDEGAKGE